MAKSNFSSFDEIKYPLDKKDKLQIGIVLAEWNEEIIERLKDSCSKKFQELNFSKKQLTFLTVPGSFELPWGAKQFLSKGGYDGIICFGCVIQGETKHDDYINHSIAKALMTLNLTSNVPIIFGVLTTNNKDQAIERSGGSRGDKGSECAEAVLKMISASQQLKLQKGKIGF